MLSYDRHQQGLERKESWAGTASLPPASGVYFALGSRVVGAGQECSRISVCLGLLSPRLCSKLVGSFPSIAA